MLFFDVLYLLVWLKMTDVQSKRTIKMTKFLQNFLVLIHFQPLNNNDNDNNNKEELLWTPIWKYEHCTSDKSMKKGT